jgi:dipeptidyl aminopeptidase/acylaminoacyl peptidase
MESSMMKRRMTLISFTASALIFGNAINSAARADELKFPTNEELRHVKALADPRLSPDGTRALYQITDAAADGGRTHIFVVDVAANASRQLTYSTAADKSGERHARWLNEGNVLFLAKRGEHMQIFRLPMSGGEAKPFELSVLPPVDESLRTDAIPPRKSDDSPAKAEPQPLDVEDFEVAPGGKLIAVLAKDPETPGEKKQKDAKADAQWVDHDLHGKRLYLLDADTGKLTDAAIAPDVAQIAWSKNAEQLIALVEPPNGVGDLGPSNTAWLLNAKDPAHPSQVKEFPFTAGDVIWAADGSQIYFLAQARRDAPPGYSDLFVLTLADRTVKNLGDGFSGSFGGRSAIQDKNLLQSVEIGTRVGYVRVRGDKLEPVHFDTPAVVSLDCDAKGSACVWLGLGSNQPATLYFSRQLGRSARQLNTPDLLPGKWPMLNVQQVHWQNESMDIEGQLFLPPQAATGKVPLIVDVHGGPTGAWSEHFEPLVEFYVGQGWAVLRPNPRGSTGYGVAFAAANKNDLGGADYRDIMAGTDAVIAKFPIDADKLALVGYSYGGEMAGFVEGKTQRFKAIVSAAPVIDQESEYGTEGGSWYDRWFYGKPWEHPEDAWRQSPLAHVANAKTPFLLIQGEDDTTDPLGQSQEMYRALRQVGVHVEMVQYPREGHPPLSAGMRGFPTKEPWHGFDVRQRIVKFISAAFTPSP